MTRLLIMVVATLLPAQAMADKVTRSTKLTGATPEVRIAAVSGDIVVTAGKKAQVSATFDTDHPDRIQFDVGKKRIRIGSSPSDDIFVEVPPGTEVSIRTTSGDASIKGVGGDVRAVVTSGSLTITDAAQVDASAVSGDVRITGVSGDVRVKVVSGDVVIDNNARADTKLVLETVSGDIEWRGLCAKDCRLELQALSGDLDLRVDPKSSFDLEFQSRSGDFKNRAKAKVRTSTGNSVEATYGQGLGRIQVVTFSSDLRLDTQ